MKRLLLLLPIACLAQDAIPVVCPDCDVEALEAPWICPKCGRKLDAPAAEPAPAPAAEDAAGPAPERAAAVGSAIREDARFAAARAESAPAAALAAVRNALALSALEPDALSPADRKALVSRETALLAALASETASCQHCRGTGRVDAPKPPRPVSRRGSDYKDIESVAVSGLNAKNATSACPLCGGAGRMRRATDRKRLAGLVGEGVRDYGRAVLAAGREETGGVWIPAGLAASLPGEDLAALRRAAPATRACPSCAGTGTRPCPSCDGFGRAVCGNRPFHSPPRSAGEGADHRTVESALLAPPSHDPCPVCGGAWDSPRSVACPACAGRGVSSCASCSGTGAAPAPDSRRR